MHPFLLITMPKESSLIETGVDKLIRLIDQEKKISVADAAKKLSLPRVVIEEWLDFLEEKDIVKIEYKFTTPYIVKRELTKKDIDKKSKDFSGRKEAFMRKAQTLLQNLDAESDGLKKLHSEFESMGKDVEKNVKTVEDDIVILERYEKLKRGIDKEIIAQQKDFESKLSKLNATLAEKGKRYEELVESIRKLEMKLLQDKSRVESIQKTQDSLKSNLLELSNAIDVLRDELKKGNKDVEGEYDALDRLKILADRAKRDFEQKGNEVKSLIAQSETQEKKILHSQQDILKKVMERTKEIDTRVESGQKAKERFDRFFSRKNDINQLIAKMDHEVSGLEVELKDLLAEVKIFDLTASGTGKSKGSMHDISDAEAHFEKIKQKKESFEKEIGKLSQMITK